MHKFDLKQQLEESRICNRLRYSVIWAHVDAVKYNWILADFSN